MIFEDVVYCICTSECCVGIYEVKVGSCEQFTCELCFQETNWQSSHQKEISSDFATEVSID